MANYYRTGLLLWAILMLNACNQSTQKVFRSMDDLKKYGLVFRLADYKNRVAYFEKNGLAERAKAEKTEIDQNNRDLVAHFQNEFDFCPIHFYYASQQEELLAGKRVLLNSNMQPDASIPLPDKVILANFDPGKVDDNTFKWKAFRVEGSSIEIRPTYLTWWTDRPIKAKDVRRINNVLHKMN